MPRRSTPSHENQSDQGPDGVQLDQTGEQAYIHRGFHVSFVPRIDDITICTYVRYYDVDCNHRAVSSELNVYYMPIGALTRFMIETVTTHLSSVRLLVSKIVGAGVPGGRCQRRKGGKFGLGGRGRW